MFEEHLCPHWITLKMSEIEKREAKLYFYEKSAIPGVIMCVDGTHIKISKPTGDDTHLYYNRKGFYSLNTMIVIHNYIDIYTNITYFFILIFLDM